MMNQDDRQAGFIPVLRADVRLDVAADGTGALIDPALGRRIRLDLRGVALCRALRGPGPTVGVDTVAHAIRASAEVVDSFARRLVDLDLLTTKRAAIRRAERLALAEVKAQPGLHLQVLAGARFACTMCGSCCGGHNVGPVSETVLDGLEVEIEALEPLIREARHLDKDLFVTLPPGDRARAGTQVMCHASNGSCVFLDDAGKCRIHARVGGAKKPLPCRIFPWEIVATPTGVRVAIQRECRDFLAATSAGAPSLEAAHDELVALVEAIGELPTVRPIPTLRGHELASWAAWEELEQRLFAALAGSDATDPGATFQALAACLGAAPGVARFAEWRAGMLAPLTQMLQAAPARSERFWIRVEGLQIAIDALLAGHGWVLGRALGGLEGDAATLFREHLRHALWTGAPLGASSVEAGLGRLIAEWVLARLIALVRAREVKRFHVTVQDLLDGLVIASFLFRHEDLQPVLGGLDGLTAAVFVDGLDELFREAPALDAPDRRVELVKF